MAGIEAASEQGLRFSQVAFKVFVYQVRIPLCIFCQYFWQTHFYMQLILRQSEPECLRQLNEEGPGEEIQGGDSIASFQDWVLPAKEIHGLWERYDVIVFWITVQCFADNAGNVWWKTYELVCA